MLVRFETMTDFALAAKAAFESPTYTSCNERRKSGSTWMGGNHWTESVKQCIRGTEELATKTQGLLDKLELSLPATLSTEVIRSPFGSRVNYGEWLAGCPTPMRRRVRRSNDMAPIKVVVDTTASAVISAETLDERGAAILAFVLKAQTIRPVELFLFTQVKIEHEDYLQLVKIESKPIALGQAAFGLCSQAFTRQLTYGIADQKGFEGQWSSLRDNHAAIRSALGISEQDIYIKEAYARDPLISDSIAWITNELTKLGGIEQ
jgi:hypothetical protein